MKQKRRSWPWLLLLVFVGLAVQFAMWPAAWADAVFLGVTVPLWSRVTSVLVAAVPGSLSAALLLLVVVVFLVAIISGRRAAGRGFRLVLWLVAIGILTFPFVFGLGYHTTSLEERLGLTAPTAGPASGALAPIDAAVQTSIAAEAVLTVLVEAAHEVGANATSGAATTPPDQSAPETAVEMAAACLSAYVPAVLDEPLPTVAGSVKSLPAGWLLRFGFAGVANPWLLEPHVDAGLPTAAGLAVALHELAHTVGFAREAEAEAVGLLAGMSCTDARVRYAASLKAASSFSDLLTPLARESYLSRWPAVATADEAAATAASQRFLARGAADLAARAYDTYLGSQGMAGGMDDYGRATTIVAQVISRDGPPIVLRSP